MQPEPTEEEKRQEHLMRKWFIGAPTVIFTIHVAAMKHQLSAGALLEWVITLGFFKADPGRGWLAVVMAIMVIAMGYFAQKPMDRLREQQGWMQWLFWPVFVYVLYILSNLFLIAIGMIRIV